ncbi:MAG: cytochrome c oxidase subunit 2A [Candidatus Eremiobacteraeota bacterium]|nr:cytochrome c oxidase subunit 2A [Candidatus Eremiobacteraeota bacterium]MBV8499066.1 cytochrome c oxidase subunit 2A [Candidatus Eremiobacteraeota bacterium]
MNDDEAPLIGTLRFVFVLGLTFIVGWLGMYALLRVRW